MANVDWLNYYRPQAVFAPQGNPALDMLRQRYAQNQQDRAANIKDFTSELAKLNFNGARDPDMPVLQQDFSKILQSFQDYRKETNPAKQAALNLKMRQLQNEFMYKAQQSRQANDEYHKDAAMAHNPNSNLTQDYWDNMNALRGISTFDPKYEQVQNQKENWTAPKLDQMKEAKEIYDGISEKSTNTTQRYNKLTGNVENVAHTSTDADPNKFINAWVATHQNDPRKVRDAIMATGIQDPAAAVLQQGRNMYEALSGHGINQTRVSNAGLTMGNREQLLRSGAYYRSEYSPSQKQTPFSMTADHIQQTAKENPSQAEDIVKSIIKKLPTKGLKGDIQVSVKDGSVIVDVPRKHTGNSPSVPAHRISIDIEDPNFGSTLQAKLHQEGFDVNSYNQAQKGKAVQTEQAKQQKSFYKTSAGKSYTHADLLKMGYTEDQIKEAIKLGNLK